MKFSVVEDTVMDIISRHCIASSDYEVCDEQCAAELINYFQEKEDILQTRGERFQWSLLVDEYPDPIRGYVHIAFVDDGILYTTGYEFWKDAWNFEIEE